MDNEYTRKEKICPLIGEYCDCDHKNCRGCISYEEDYQEQCCKEEMARLHELVDNEQSNQIEI